MHATTAHFSRSSSGRGHDEEHSAAVPGVQRWGASSFSTMLAPVGRSGGSELRPCVIEHQGATRIVHQADGSIICEPVNPPSAPPSTVGGVDKPDARGKLQLKLVQLGRAALQVGLLDVAKGTVLMGGTLGFAIAYIEAAEAVLNNRKVDTRKIIHDATQFATCCVSGAVAGALAVPGVMVLSLLRLAVRPVLLAAAVHGAVSWAARHRAGAAALLKKLQSGDLARQLEALRRLVARLEASAPFCTQFKRLAGVDTLLKLLADWLAAAESASSYLPRVSNSQHMVLATRAVADLCKQGDVVDSVVELGGVPVLLKAMSWGLATCAPAKPAAGGVAGASGMASLSSSLLVEGRSVLLEPAAAPGAGAAAATQPSSPGLLVHAAAALARVAGGHAVAQQLLASEPGAAQLVVSVLEAATARSVRGATLEACDQLRGHAVCLAQALALEPLGKAALGQAGGVEALAAALLLSSPGTQGQEAAAAALHTLVRGDVDNQRRLAAVAPGGLSAALQRALSPTHGGTGSGNSTPVPGASGPTAFSAAGNSGGKLGGALLRSGTPAAGGAAGAAAAGGGLPSGARAASPHDLHWHRADLLALSNVIARFSQQQPAQQQQQASAAPPLPAPAAAAAPRPVTLVQRLGFRRAVPAPSARPSEDLQLPALAPILTPAAATSEALLMTCLADAAPAAAAAAASSSKTPTAGAGEVVGGKGMPPGSPDSDDWEQDCSLAQEEHVGAAGKQQQAAGAPPQHALVSATA